MSDIKDLNSRIEGLQESGNKAASQDVAVREISIGQVEGCDVKKNTYRVRILDEDKIVNAKLSGLLSDGFIFSRHYSGDLVMVVHKGGSDAIILCKIDKYRNNDIKENKESDPKNHNIIQTNTAPT